MNSLLVEHVSLAPISTRATSRTLSRELNLLLLTLCPIPSCTCPSRMVAALPALLMFFALSSSHTPQQILFHKNFNFEGKSPTLKSIRVVTAMSSEPEQPKQFKFTHLWASKDGETHVTECKMTNFEFKPYAESAQFIKQSPGAPKQAVFSELGVGNFQDWHSCPTVQFVVCLAGKWFVKASDGTRREFGPGEVLFQDNIKNHPLTAKPPLHQSGVVGDQPNQQLILQIDRVAEIDSPIPKDLSG